MGKFCRLSSRLLDFWMMSILLKGQNLLEKFKFPAKKAKGLSKYVPVALAVLVGYLLADLTLLSLRPGMLPSEAPPVPPPRSKLKRPSMVSDYAVITDRNIFNSDGRIPPPLSSEGGEPTTAAEAVLSQLPLTLQGTIVHFNPQRSIGTIELNAKNISMSYIPGEVIDGMAEIVRIERRRVVFQNLNNRRLEYIEIPDEVAFNFDLQKGSTPAASTAPIEQKGRNNFSVKRSEVDRLTSDLSQVLQQARMEPRFGPGNQIDGFCFVSIQGGSIYETLGFRVGDCISSVNGEAVTNPQKAMEIYQKLRTSNNIRLGVDRDGRSEVFNYDVN